jgi:hypothetical protein
MKPFIMAFITWLLTGTVLAQTTNSPLEGIWTNEQQNLRIEFFKTNSGFAAKINWMAEPNGANGNPKLDVQNPSAQQRKKPLVGTTILYNLKYDEKKAHYTGKLYAPRRGITADCSLKRLSPSKMEVTGKMGLITDTKTWTRCNP